MGEVNIYCLSNTNKVTPKQALVPALSVSHLTCWEIQQWFSHQNRTAWMLPGLHERGRKETRALKSGIQSARSVLVPYPLLVNIPCLPHFGCKSKNQTQQNCSFWKHVAFFFYWTSPFTWGRSRHNRWRIPSHIIRMQKDQGKKVLGCFSGIFYLDHFFLFLIHMDSFMTSQQSCLSYWPCSYCWKPMLGLCSCQDWCSPWGYPSEPCVLCGHRQELERDYAWHRFWTTHPLLLPKVPLNHPGNLNK